MLKLTYHSPAVGPIDLEYDQPVIRVGSSEDNDLILRHPSVAAHHCLLVFRGDRVLCLSPDSAKASPNELRQVAGPEFGLGDSLAIGELRFTLAYSPKTIAIPGVSSKAATPDWWAGEPITGTGGESDPPPHYCPHCRLSIPDAAVKRVGLVGHPKRNLCPKCSRPLDTGVGL